MAEERDALAAKCEELAVKLLCMHDLSKMTRSLCVHVAELVEAFKTKVLKVWAKRRTANAKVVVKQARTERVEHTARIAQLKGDLLKLKSQLSFFWSVATTSKIPGILS